MIKPHFVDINPDIIDGLREIFGDQATYAVGDICKEVQKGDILVSAGNCFGIMDGGVDLAIAIHWPGLQEKVVSMIADRDQSWCLPVGSAISFEWEDFIFLYAPTMPVPQFIAHTPNVYMAMCAILNETRHWLGAERLVCCGLGTFTGGMTGKQAAWQMMKAYEARGQLLTRWHEVMNAIGQQ